MSKEYTLLTAMKEEVNLLIELRENAKKDKNKLLAGMYYNQIDSLSRIIRRYENGNDYSLGVVKGEVKIICKQTTRHLEREYPSVAKAKENLDTLVALTKGSK